MFVFYLILLPIFLSIYRSLSTTNPTNMSDPDAIRDELERRKRIRAETIAREEAEDAALLTQWRAAETAKSQTRMRVEQVQREREQEQAAMARAYETRMAQEAPMLPKGEYDKITSNCALTSGSRGT
jgi:uncharacterized membrane protein YqiK